MIQTVFFDIKRTFSPRHFRTVDASDAGGVTARVEEMDSEVRNRVDRLHLSGRVGRQRHPAVLLA